MRTEIVAFACAALVCAALVPVIRRFARRRGLFDHSDDADVDILAAFGLPAMDGDGVFAGLEDGDAFIVEGDGDVVGDVAAGGEDLHAVEIDFGVFVVMDVQGEAVELAAG